MRLFQNGDVIFSLGYLSSAERLTVVVMKARNLRHTDEGRITMGRCAATFFALCYDTLFSFYFFFGIVYVWSIKRNLFLESFNMKMSVVGFPF